MLNFNRSYGFNFIKDCPRYGWRGMFLDVVRHFSEKETVLKILDVMAMYKLNKFHIHLADDEGWRLEIPSITELAEVSLVPVLGIFIFKPLNIYIKYGLTASIFPFVRNKLLCII